MLDHQLKATSTFRLYLLSAAVMVGGLLHSAQLLAQNPPPLQTCTITNIRSQPLVGTFCGGTSSGGNCTGGALYKCDNKSSVNNCTLLQACASGCLTTESPQGKITQACNNGTLKPLTITPQTALGGTELTATAQLSNPHTGGGVILNLLTTRGDIFQGLGCDSVNLAPGINAETFGISTALVTTTQVAQITADFNWVDATGSGYELSIVPQVITLEPGGTLPPTPAIDTVRLVPTALDPGGVGFMYVTLDHIAPAGGVPINVGFSDPATISLFSGGQPFVPPGCTGSDGRENFIVARSVPKAETVNITASTDAAGQAPISTPLTINAGCVKLGCTGGPTCGTEADGCGGVITGCGCFNPQGLTCLPNGTCGSVPVFEVTSLTLNPSSVPGGRTVTGTVTSNMPAPAGGGIIAIFSDNPLVTVNGAVTIPAGATTASFPLKVGNLPPGGAQTALIHADDQGSATALLTITPTVACTPQSCASQAKNCGSVSDGCGGTLNCGVCAAGQSCGGGGVANRCGGSTTGPVATGTLTVTATGGGGDITTTPSAGIKTSPGHPSSGVFNIDTSITLKTSDGHGAVWSGACSSNGAMAQSCTFTFNGTSSVTANNK
jgi:hypothetical protein